MPIKMVVGLGNPGEKYKGTRHNIGRDLVESLKDAPLPNPVVWFVTQKRYMNETGIEVAEAARYKNIKSDEILVVLDEFQIPLRQIKILKSGSDGGHNGLQSVLDSLGTSDVPRMRIGIKTDAMPSFPDSADFVLGRFSKTEKQQFDVLMPKLEDAVLTVIKQGLDAAMNKFNGILLA